MLLATLVHLSDSISIRPATVGMPSHRQGIFSIISGINCRCRTEAFQESTTHSRLPCLRRKLPVSRFYRLRKLYCPTLRFSLLADISETG